MARVYIQNQLAELMQSHLAVKLLVPTTGNLQDDFLRHIDFRVNSEYPTHLHGRADGAMPDTISKALQEAETTHKTSTHGSAFDKKPATGHDIASADTADVLSDLRPSIVQGLGRGTRCKFGRTDAYDHLSELTATCLMNMKPIRIVKMISPLCTSATVIQLGVIMFQGLCFVEHTISLVASRAHCAELAHTVLK